MTTDEQVLTQLDFQSPIACDGLGHEESTVDSPLPHEGPAVVLVHSGCPSCMSRHFWTFCKPWWDFLSQDVVKNGDCPICGAPGMGQEFYTVVERF